MLTNSWIIVNRATREAVMETYSPALVATINTAKYEAMTAYDYLCDLNRRIKDQS